MKKEIRIEKLQQVLIHYQEAWDLVMDWSGGWSEKLPYPDGKSRTDWMISMAMIAGTIQELIDAEVDGDQERAGYLI